MSEAIEETTEAADEALDIVVVDTNDPTAVLAAAAKYEDLQTLKQRRKLYGSWIRDGQRLVNEFLAAASTDDETKAALIKLRGKALFCDGIGPDGESIPTLQSLLDQLIALLDPGTESAVDAGIVGGDEAIEGDGAIAFDANPETPDETPAEADADA